MAVVQLKTGTQKCKTCKEVKPLIEFLYRKDRGRHRKSCIKCTQQHLRDWHHKNPRKQMLYGAKHRAKKLGLPFDLTIEDLVVPDACPVFGIKLEHGKGKMTLNSPQLDRVVPDKGYVKGNVRVISQRANSLKNSLTVTELRMLIEYIEANGGK